ncbi:3-phosphoshikimate 1-carboxyvinyltransferase [soil metagenome]
MKLTQANKIVGRIDLPGDKSISHRAAMLAALADGVSVISNFASSADCRSTLEVLRNIGVEWEADGGTVRVSGKGGNGFRSPDLPLDCGNSGTTMRLFAGMAAGLGLRCELIGDESLTRRPMQRIIEPLTKMGAEIRSTVGHAPLQISGNQALNGIEYRTPVASAQIKSSILLAGLNASGTTCVIEAAASRDHTERMLGHFGVKIMESFDGKGRRVSIEGGQRLTAADIAVPADISSAAFFACAAAALPDSQIEMPNVGLNPTRTAILEVLEQCGVEVAIENRRTSANEPIGDLRVSYSGRLVKRDPNFAVRGPMVANLIDEIPILAVLATQIEGGLEFRDAAELRVKETDRISGVAENLRRMGADVREFPDGLRVERSEVHGAAVNSFGDHRIAMAFAVAGLFAEGETQIDGHECVNVSFPGFFEELESIVIR